MAKIALYNQKGEKKGDVTLNDSIFGVAMNEQLIARMLQYQSINGRNVIAHVKNRAEVKGGGRKPFRQKGTGHARQGTIRAGHMKGGGRSFGPKKWRSFTELMPKKQRRKALFVALSKKVSEGKVLALNEYKGDVKTKDFKGMLDKLPLERNTLIVIPAKSEAIQKSSANIPNVKTILVNYVNVFDLLKYNNILFLEDSIKKAEELFTSNK